MHRKFHFARQLRKDPTPSETRLWEKLRRGQFHDLKFRRQFLIQPFIVDFYCHEKQLIIEVDGDTHFVTGAKQADQERQKYLEELGYRVVRFTSDEVIKNIDGVLECLEQVVVSSVS